MVFVNSVELHNSWVAAQHPHYLNLLHHLLSAELAQFALVNALARIPPTRRLVAADADDTVLASPYLVAHVEQGGYVLRGVLHEHLSRRQAASWRRSAWGCIRRRDFSASGSLLDLRNGRHWAEWKGLGAECLANFRSALREEFTHTVLRACCCDSSELSPALWALVWCDFHRPSSGEHSTYNAVSDKQDANEAPQQGWCSNKRFSSHSPLLLPRSCCSCRLQPAVSAACSAPGICTFLPNCNGTCNYIVCFLHFACGERTLFHEKILFPRPIGEQYCTVHPATGSNKRT